MVGRTKEIKELEKLYSSGRAELVAVYGRRRVGKTYLVDETFGDRLTFRHAGLSPEGGETKGLLREQLAQFAHSLELFGMKEPGVPSSWMDAFFLLEKFLQDRDDGTRQVVFLDELPWLDTPRSGFMRAFEGFWNNWGCHRKNLMVIVCGSANSWIQDKLINNHGGLYNRVTHEIKLSPFTLGECEEFYRQAGVRLSRYDIVQSYMILGGIPFYMGYLDGELSLAQNVDELFFAHEARLGGEFDRLFASLFTNPEAAKAIVRILSSRGGGYTRAEVVSKLGVSDGGGLSRTMKALIASDFVRKYVPFGCGKREERYMLVDPFCKFWLHFLDGGRISDSHYWRNNLNAQQVVTWRGIAFEGVCLAHVEQIKKALGVAGVASQNSAWVARGGESGTQIDLVISRADNVANMCEMKFYSGDFEVDKGYYKTLLNRQEVLTRMVPAKTVVRSTLVTTFGLAHNEYSGAFSNVITMDDLFA